MRQWSTWNICITKPLTSGTSRGMKTAAFLRLRTSNRTQPWSPMFQDSKLWSQSCVRRLRRTWKRTLSWTENHPIAIPYESFETLGETLKRTLWTPSESQQAVWAWLKLTGNYHKTLVKPSPGRTGDEAEPSIRKEIARSAKPRFTNAISITSLLSHVSFTGVGAKRGKKEKKKSCVSESQSVISMWAEFKEKPSKKRKHLQQVLVYKFLIHESLVMTTYGFSRGSRPVRATMLAFIKRLESSRSD